MPPTNAGFINKSLLMQHGPTLWVQVGFDVNYRAGGVPELPGDELPALIDSGALQSCIDLDLAVRLGLLRVDVLPIIGVHGAQDAPFYVAHIRVPALRLTRRGKLAGLPLQRSGFSHSVLLGRDFLANVNMLYLGDVGSVEITLAGEQPSR